MKKIAILQSNYIPWKGYFDIINKVDEFIIYDEVQYTKRDWRNRNLIKSAQGLHWLTVPVHVKGAFSQKIADTRVADANWNKKHWECIRQNYCKAPFFRQYQEPLKEAYLGINTHFISEINLHFIQLINQLLGIHTPVSHSTDYLVSGDKTERLVQLVKAVGGTCYLSGPMARGYLDERAFERENLVVEWMDYTAYPEYRQHHPPFEHGVSVLDLLFHTGDNAPEYMLSFNEETVPVFRERGVDIEHRKPVFDFYKR